MKEYKRFGERGVLRQVGIGGSGIGEGAGGRATPPQERALEIMTTIGNTSPCAGESRSPQIIDLSGREESDPRVVLLERKSVA